MTLGLPQRNINNLQYTGETIAIVPVVQSPREPTVSDTGYPLFCLWRNSTNNNAWILVGFSSGDALWRLFQFGGSSGTVDSLTGNDAIVVGPDGSGNINVKGDGTTITIAGNAGTNTLTAAILSGGFKWQDQGTSITVSVQNGYVSTAVITLTLPNTPANGSTIKFEAGTTDVLTIAAGASDKIRLGNDVTASTGGTSASTKQGDAIELIYRSSANVWIAQSSIGNWTVT